MSEFHFLRPLAFVTLIPLALLVWKLSRNKQQLHSWLSICDAHLLKHLTTTTTTRVKHFAFTILTTIGLLMILALAGPTWQRIAHPVFKQKQARVIVLDLSNAMLGQDIKPNRLTRAKFLIRDLLKQADIGQLGMVAFTRDGFTVSPLTDDARTLEALVDELSPQMMPIAGSNIASGLKQAQQLIEQAGYNRGQIILFTANAADGADDDAARQLAKNNISLDIIGMATKAGAPVPSDDEFIQPRNNTISHLPTQSLSLLAQSGNGRFIPFKQLKSIDSLVTINPSTKFHKNKDKQFNSWHDMGRYLILFILPLLLVLFRRGYLENVA